MIFLFEINDIVLTKDGDPGLVTFSRDDLTTYRVNAKGKRGWYSQYLEEEELAILIPCEGRSKEEMRDLLLIISKLS